MRRLLVPPAVLAAACATAGLAAAATPKPAATTAVAPAAAASAQTADARTPKPPDVPPFVQCVYVNDDGTYTAHFGTHGQGNGEGSGISVPVGPDNYVTPASFDGRQPTEFKPGRREDVWVVRVPNTTDITWTLTGSSATASLASPLCAGSPQPPPVITPHAEVEPQVRCVYVNADDTYTAHFDVEAQAEGRPPTVTVPLGPDNVATPASFDGRQPTQFRDGHTTDAWVVKVPVGVSLSWKVTTHRATASLEDELCGGSPPRPPKEPLVTPATTCVYANGDGTYTAWLTATNTGAAGTIPVGSSNRATPAELDGRQPTSFPRGVTEWRPHVPIASTVTWTVQGRSTSASAATRLCDGSPPIVPPPAPVVHPVLECVEPEADGTFTAHYGYSSESTASVTVPRGSANAVSPGRFDGLQPTVFAPGRHVDVWRATAGRAETVVWTLTGRTATATASSKPCATLPPEPPPSAEVSPVLECVDGTAGGGFVAHFGYLNHGADPVTVPVGSDNAVSPASLDGGQPTRFDPGRAVDVWRPAAPPGTTLVWRLTGRTATATASSRHCATEPPASEVSPVLECVQANQDGTFTAHFGYSNPAAAAVTVPLGPENRTTPAAYDGSQPTRFEPGRVVDAWNATAPNAVTLVWALTGRTSTATSTSKPCAAAQQADVAVAWAGAPATVEAGQRFDVRVRVENLGPATAEQVVLDGVSSSLVSAVGLPSGCTAQPRVTCDVGALEAGRSATLSFHMLALSAGTATATVAATAVTPDPNLDNNKTAGSLPITAPGVGPGEPVDPELPPAGLRLADVAVAASGPRVARVGDALSYVLTVRNDGPDPATSAVLDVVVPGGISVSGATEAAGGHCAVATGHVACSLGDLAKGASRRVTVSAHALAAGIHRLVASAASQTFDPDSANNVASVVTVVVAPGGGGGGAGSTADVVVDKTRLSADAVAGRPLVFLVRVANVGTRAASDVRLVDGLSARVRLLFVTTSKGSCSAALRLRCAFGTLRRGDTVAVHVAVVPLAPGRLVNVAAARTATPESRLDNNRASVSTVVSASGGARLGLELDQQASAPRIAVGQAVTLTLVVRNTGGPARDLVVCTRLGQGLAAVSVDGAGRIRGQVACWHRSSFAAGARLVLHLGAKGTSQAVVPSDAAAVADHGARVARASVAVEVVATPGGRPIPPDGGGQSPGGGGQPPGGIGKG